MSLVLSVVGPKDYRENLGFLENRGFLYENRGFLENLGFLKKTSVFSLMREYLGFQENPGFL